MIKSKFVRQHFGPILDDKEQFFKDCHLFIELKKKSAAEFLDFLENEHKKNKEIIHHYCVWAGFVIGKSKYIKKSLRYEYTKFIKYMWEVFNLNLEFKDYEGEFVKDFNYYLKDIEGLDYIDLNDPYYIKNEIEYQTRSQMNNMLDLPIPEFIQASKDLNKLIPRYYFYALCEWFENEQMSSKNLVYSKITFPNFLLPVYVPLNLYKFSRINWQINNCEEYKRFKDDFDEIYGLFLKISKEELSKEKCFTEPEEPFDDGKMIIQIPLVLNKNEEKVFFEEQESEEG